MIFESKEFKNVSEYDQVYKDFKDKIKTGLNVSFNFNLTQSLYDLYGCLNGDFVPLVNGSIDYQKNFIKNRTIFTSYKLVSYDLNIKKRK